MSSRACSPRLRAVMAAIALLAVRKHVRGQGLEVVTSFNNDQGQPSGRLVEGADGAIYGTTSRGGKAGWGSVFRLSIASEPTLTDVHAFTTLDGSPDFKGGLTLGPGGYMYGTIEPVSGVGHGSIYRVDPSGRVAIVHDFTGPLALAGELLYASDGHLYGTNPAGGAAHIGSIFRLEDDGSITTIHEFDGTQGQRPEAPLMQASDGWIYGTTYANGFAGGEPGTIFRIRLSGEFEFLHALSADEGFHIEAGLAEAPNGYLYGGAFDGGANGFGTIFRVNAAGDFQKLHDIDQAAGYGMRNTLVLFEGELWGVMRDGYSGFGAVYKIHPEGAFTIMHGFQGGFDAAHPSSPLTLGSDGWLYGAGGQLDQQLGTLYRVGLGGVFEVLWRFGNDEPTGMEPGVVEGQDGRLYGVQDAGGANGYGALFAVSQSGDVEYLHFFDGQEARGAFSLMRAADGSVYGVDDQGGRIGRGTIFHYDTATGFSLLHAFRLDEGANPSSLVQASDGNFYGATLYGGAGGVGTVFRMAPNGAVTTIHDFQPAETGGPNHLLEAQNGSIVGTSTFDGGGTDGAVFTVDLDGGGFRNLVSFDAATTGAPPTGLIQAPSGDLFGTGLRGGAEGSGTVFRVDATPTLSVMHTFQYPTGEDPAGGVVTASDGSLYGTTSSGGSTTFGTLFRISPAGGFESLWTFHGADGSHPAGPLFPASDGSLYGTAFGGNPSTRGVIYRWVLSPPAPAIESVEPSSGPALFPTILGVRGSHFQFQPVAEVGGTPSAQVVGLDSRTVRLKTPPLSPGTVADVTISNPDGSSSTLAAAYFADFLDVDSLQTFHDDVESIVRAGITAGCGGGNFCPVAVVTRAQMAVFLLKAEHGAAYAPPACSGVYADTPCPGLFTDWIEQLAAEGVTGGCGGGNYCPMSRVTRAQTAIFLLKTLLGAAYVPPAAVGVFGDVPPGSFAADWIEDLYGRQITGGCSASPLLYCPNNSNTRGQMAVFLTKTFGLP